jgi:hypothetical protein
VGDELLRLSHQEKFVYHNFGDGMLDALFVLIGMVGKFTFNEHFLAFGKLSTGPFDAIPPDAAGVPLGFFDDFAFVVGVLIIGSYGKIGDLFAGIEGFNFGIPAEITDQGNTVSDAAGHNVEGLVIEKILTD